MQDLATREPPTYVISLPIEDLEQRIRNAAYELYEARGRKDGHALDDWLRAEEQIWELH
jgi:Protein of unknown function (DUF2934)